MHASDPELYLASRSPRRAELLTQIGVRFEILDAEVDETPRPGEAPEAYVLRVSEDKARGGVAARGARAPRPVLAADTAVVCDGRVLGKPADRAEALAMLAALSGREHRVMTGVALAADGRIETRTSVSRVRMRAIDEAERRAYVDTGEPLDKAGAYAIQGRAAIFVEALSGSYSGVMGLPLYETAELLAAAGVAVLPGPEIAPGRHRAGCN